MNAQIEAIRAIAAMRGEPWAIQPEAMAALRASLVTVATGGPPPEAFEGDGYEDEKSESQPRGGVAVVPLTGIITPGGGFLSRLFGIPGGLKCFHQQLVEAADDDDISAIVIHVDSPGGRASLVPEVAAEVRRLREVKPIIAVASTLATSAAYWIASQAQEIIVTPSGFAGSIGVVSTHEDISAMEERIGIKTTLIFAGKYKTEGNPFEPLDDEAKAAIQAEVNVCYERFAADVATGRNTTVDAVKSGYGEGRVLSAELAVEAGLADRVETLDETVQRLVGAQPANRSDGLTADTQLHPLVADHMSRRQRVLI